MVNLRWFRKHQKVMLVVFGVILMGVFVIGGVTPFWGGSGGGASPKEIARINQTIVQWSGGKLSRGQLGRLLDLHYATMRFQEALMQDAITRSSQGPLVHQIPAIRNDSLESADQAIFGRFMMAEYARKKLGIVVSDSAVLDFLQALSNSDASQQYLVNIARKTDPNVGYSQLHEYLKMELTAMRLDQILGASFSMSGSGGAAPANVLDAWQAFLQNEKQIECAVEEFNAADFVQQIKDEPSTAELRAWYEEGKSFGVDPIGERPGFKLPRKVCVEYVSADASAFMELAIQDVTPEQVLAEYNRLVEIKDPLVMERIPAAESNPAEKLDGEKLEDDPPPEQGDKSGESKDPAPTPESGDVDPAPTEKPPAEKPSNSDDGGKQDDPPTDSEKEKKPDPAPSDSPEDKSGGGHLLSFVDVKYVSLVTSVQEPSQSPNPQEEKPAEPESKPAESANSEKTPPSETTDNQGQDPPPQQPEMKPDAPAAAAQDTGAPAVSAPQEEPTDRPKKLDAELELAIKQRLKREEANQRLLAAVEKARELMNDYALALSGYESTKDLPLDEQLPMPLQIDLKAFAADNHLKYGLTELCTKEDLIKEPIGMATEFHRDPTTGGLGMKRASDDLFDNFDRKHLFSVDEINSMGNRYLYWLTEKVDSRIPSFDEARNEMINFWKRKKSVELAKSAAEKVRDEIQAGGKNLIEEHKDKAKLTGAFRWFQAAFNQNNYGTPQGVKNPGEEFMSTAFGLTPNEVGVALNEDRTAAYVIQLIAGDPRTNEQLRDQFLDHIASVRQVVPSATNTFYSLKSVDRLLDLLNDELEVEWIAY